MDKIKIHYYSFWVDGFVLVDKPKGWTSFDVVNKVRHLAQNSELNTSKKKRFPAGHTGTLDPLATGLLVLLLGDYTKQATALIKLDKAYEVTMKLGETSSTGDEEGEKTTTSDQIPALIEISEVLQKFVGEIEQIPPAHSAIKINGQRAYKLARAGKAVKIESRKVEIISVTLTNYEYPFVEFTSKVGSGTYIRSLVQDIGKELQTGAYMSDLRRTNVGEFDIKDAISLDNIDADKILKNLKTLA